MVTKSYSLTHFVCEGYTMYVVRAILSRLSYAFPAYSQHLLT